MTAKLNTPSRATPRTGDDLPAEVWTTPPSTMKERLERIEALGKRINSYIQFIGAVGSLDGTSAEAKENAVTAFHERMVVAERQLGRIFEDLQLG
jgi:hypothetical protein